jgi:hypothetical protein
MNAATTTTLATTPREKAIADIFCTALEGGIGYWSRCSEYRWSDGTPAMNQINEFRAVVQDAEDDEAPTYVIDKDVIRRGTQRLYKHLIDLGDAASRYHLKAMRDFNAGKWDDLDYDADTADMIVQFGLFNELVYG